MVRGKPDLPGWRVFGESYEDTHQLVETGVRFTLDCNAEDRGESSAADYPRSSTTFQRPPSQYLLDRFMEEAAT
jgi:hypothetical protein